NGINLFSQDNGSSLPKTGFTWPGAGFPTTANAHSHNDYEKKAPFTDAYAAGFGSIEADVFLEKGLLLVAHSKDQFDAARTLQSLYLDPINAAISKNGGRIYADSSRSLQLMIDFKTDGGTTMAALLEVLKNYPAITSTASVRIVISGNRPDVAAWNNLPPYIFIDGELEKSYNTAQLSRIPMLSTNFATYSKWNGKGRLPEAERMVISGLIDKAHKSGKKVRFWNAPDILNSWYAFLDEGVDYINTDQVAAISRFFEQLPDRSFTNPVPAYELYKPTYKNDGTTRPIRNVIILIGDGTGLPQWYAGYTANHAGLNVFNMHYTGLSKTSSFDNYITDSAPGATAISSGVKTNNRAVGVDHTGQKLELLPMIVKRRGMKTGVITSGDLRDATPASFYAHRPERSDNTGIITDLLAEPIDLIMGACPYSPSDSLFTRVKKQFSFYTSPSEVRETGKPVFVADPTAAKHMYDGRG
ncbi:MAG: alkaline phosphatase, partial [Chitinophagaceae bacterium]